MGAQNAPRARVKRIVIIAGRMIRWNIEGFEIMKLGLNLGPLLNGVTQGDEDLLQFSAYQGDGVELAQGGAAAGQGAVEPLAR